MIRAVSSSPLSPTKQTSASSCNPLLNGIVSFKQKDIIEGIISISSFVLALIFFACFVMGDKEQFQNTILKYEGLWERFTLFCLYIPFIYKTIGNLLF